MKNYSLFFEDKRFETAVIPASKSYKPYELYEDEGSLFILLPTPKNDKEQLKIYYPKSLYLPQLHKMQRDILLQLLMLSLVAIIISILFSLYTLNPLRRSLILLETFIKDMIHDLNTPISNILINLKMMDNKSEEVESITKSTQTISMLHNNLNTYLHETRKQHQKFHLREVMDQHVGFFSSMYQHLNWKITTSNPVLVCDKDAFSRILYNLISNACKYNTADGYIHIHTEGETLSISNSSYGIRNPSKVFERFYKEGERGLGIGLHIVETLCGQLDIPKKLSVKDTAVTFSLSLERVTFK